MHRSSDEKTLNNHKRAYLFCSSIIAGFKVILIPWQLANENWEPRNAIKTLETLRRSVSLGSIAENFEEIKESFDQAKKLLFHVEKKYSKQKNIKGVFLYDDMIFDLAICLFAEMPEAQALWEMYWQPLKMESKAKCVPLQEFASTFIDTNLNLSLCAKRLNIHYNTARNYLEETKKMLGFSFEDPKHYLSFCLARQIDLTVCQKRDYIKQ